jgi:hypothetical protein
MGALQRRRGSAQHRCTQGGGGASDQLELALPLACTGRIEPNKTCNLLFVLRYWYILIPFIMFIEFQMVTPEEQHKARP